MGLLEQVDISILDRVPDGSIPPIQNLVYMKGILILLETFMIPHFCPKVQRAG